MTSPLLALFVRSLREDSRLKFTYFSRAGLVSVLVVVLVATQSSMGWVNAPGLEYFSTVAFIDLLFVMLAGVSYFCSAISEEKEEMTLGLLRMTNLNSLSILLGKSTSRLCHALLLFTAQIPFTLLAITLGGISLQQICAAYLAIGAFLVLVCNLGLLASVICRRTSAAAVLTGVTLLVFLLVVPLTNRFTFPFRVAGVKSSGAWTNALLGLIDLCKSASPFYQISDILETGKSQNAVSFQVCSNLVLGLVFFLLAWAVFDRYCGEQKDTAPSRAGIGRAGRGWGILRPGRAWRRALIWKDFYFMAGGWRWVFMKLAIYGSILFLAIYAHADHDDLPDWDEVGIGIFQFALVFLVAELSFAATTIFLNEHQGQTLSSLAMLPQGIRRVAYQKLLGVLPGLCAAAACLFVSIPLFAKSAYRDWNAHRDDNRNFELMVGAATVAVQVLFFLHLVAVLSLYVKRGALPLAMGILILLAVIANEIIHDLDGLCLLLLFTLAATAIIHVHIGHRLEAIAAEE